MQKTKQAFTLIELLVSISLVAILSAGVISLIGLGPRKSANDARRFSDLNRIASALELYRTDNSKYPLSGQYPAVLSGYINSLPADPSGPAYTYTSTTGVLYALCSDSFERQVVNVVNNCDTATHCCVNNP